MAHSYADDGSYEVRLTVTNPDGLADTDAGVLDTHTASVAWGDGSTTAAAVTQGPGAGTLEVTHTYTSAGVYSVPVTLGDDDGGSATDAFQYAVV